MFLQKVEQCESLDQPWNTKTLCCSALCVDCFYTSKLFFWGVRIFQSGAHGAASYRISFSKPKVTFHAYSWATAFPAEGKCLDGCCKAAKDYYAQHFLYTSLSLLFIWYHVCTPYRKDIRELMSKASWVLGNTVDRSGLWDFFTRTREEIALDQIIHVWLHNSRHLCFWFRLGLSVFPVYKEHSWWLRLLFSVIFSRNGAETRLLPHYT